MAVYFKFKSAKDYDFIPIEGQFISVGNLKERIFETKHLGRGTDFDLVVSNAQTNEEYTDETALIPKNTSVLIRRVPGRPRKTIVAEPDELKAVAERVEDVWPPIVADSSAVNPEESEWDEFGNDPYASITDGGNPAHSFNPAGADLSTANKVGVDEDTKIKALIDTPALDWSSQGQEGYGGGRVYGRGRMMAGRGFGRGMFERRTPPPGYVCHRCKIPGHFIQHCPTNGDPQYDVKRVKPPTGIPKSMLMANPDGSYALPGGAVAVMKPNEAAFEKEIEGLPTARPSQVTMTDLPPELRCPLCKEVMKDAVLTSKCCFTSFCDDCIRDYIISKSSCVCGATNVLADDLLPNKTLRGTISHMLESTTSSTENAGNLVLVQDMESAIPVRPKVASPVVSAASKEEDRKVETTPTLVENSPEAANSPCDGLKLVPAAAPEATPESMNNGKEQKSPEIAPPLPKDSLDNKPPAGDPVKKKKKKKTTKVPGADEMQWRNYPDMGAENFAGMPLAAAGAGGAGYNPYWGPGIPPLGMDGGYMSAGAPFAGPVPYMGFPPGPFDVPFGGAMLHHDPFAAQAFMMPPPPRDLAELAVGSMGMNMGGPPLLVRRDEFEAARRSDLRRKREMELHAEREREYTRRERERSRDRETRREGKESRIVKDVTSVKKLSKKPTTQIEAPVERSDRPERSKRDSSHSREPARDSPHRSTKKRSSELDEASPAAAVGEALTKKQKGSVFSRISFPEEAGPSKKKKSSSEAAALKKNGLKEEPPEPADRSGRDEWKGRKRSYDEESSEDGDEEEYHFKRRRSRKEAADLQQEEDDGRRRSRRSRDRDRGDYERASTKQR